MNFSAYIQRQKNLIRLRHEGEAVLIVKGERELITCETIYNELDNMAGLNKKERGAFCDGRVFPKRKAGA